MAKVLAAVIAVLAARAPHANTRKKRIRKSDFLSSSHNCLRGRIF
jgi:hypothetical protein